MQLSHEGAHLRQVLDTDYDVFVWMGGYYSYVIDSWTPGDAAVRVNATQWAQDVQVLRRLRARRPGAVIIVVGLATPHFWEQREHAWGNISWARAIDRLDALQRADVRALGGIFLPTSRMTAAVPEAERVHWMFDWIHYRGEVAGMVARVLLHAACGHGHTDARNTVAVKPVKTCKGSSKFNPGPWVQWTNTTDPGID